MLELWISDDAEADLLELKEAAPNAAYFISALLEQISADSNLIGRLNQEDFESDESPGFNVDAVESLQKMGLNIWRLKVWTARGETVFYRVIYAFDKNTGDYSVLGIMRRDINYEPDHPQVQRIIAAYHAFDIPPI